MNWYEIKAKKEISEVWLYDEIGLWGIGAKQFIAELNGIKSPMIDLHINSPGGEVFDGAAIYNAIKRHPAKVTAYIDGIAASIASVIALAGEQVLMAENSLYMMHNPFGLVMGEASDMRKTADLLDKIRETMIGAYVAKSGKGEDEIRAMLDAETWFDAQEAADAGFVDGITDKIDMAACTKFAPAMSKMGFKRVPRAITDNRRTPKPKDLELALQGAGCTRSQAKSILATGIGEHLRDVDPPAIPGTDGEPHRDVAPPPPARVDRTDELLQRVV